MKIIIVGCGKVGVTLVEQLRGEEEDNDMVVIDTSYEKVQDISDTYDVMGVVGSGSNHSILMEAGIETADLLIAVTGSDELNLLCCLVAKKSGKNCRTIARVRSPEYEQEINFIQGELGLAMVINPDLICAMEMARVMRFPSAIKVEPFAKGRLELLQFRIPEHSPLEGMSLAQMSKAAAKAHNNVLVCAVLRGEEIIIPGGDFILREKDVLAIMASPKTAAQYFKRIKVQTNQVRDCMIVGGGSTAYYLAKQLLAMGIDVKIIDKDRARCEELSEALPKATIIWGEGTKEDVLMEEDLPHMDAFVALTSGDEENVLLSLLVREKAPQVKVLTKVINVTFESVIEKMGLESTAYPQYITAEYIIRFVRAMKNSVGNSAETLYRLMGNRIEALEFTIRRDSRVLNKPIEQMKLKKNLLIAGIYRDGESITPRGQDLLQLGDKVVVVTTNIGLDDIEDILAE